MFLAVKHLQMQNLTEWLDHLFSLIKGGQSSLRPSFVNTLFPVTHPHTTFPYCINNYYYNLKINLKYTLFLFKIMIL